MRILFVAAKAGRSGAARTLRVPCGESSSALTADTFPQITAWNAVGCSQAASLIDADRDGADGLPASTML